MSGISGNTPSRTPIAVVVKNFANQDLLSDTEVKRILPILQQQANVDFIEKHWAKALDPKTPTMSLKLIKTTDDPPADAWLAEIYDDSQEAILVGRVENLSDDDLGYHDLDRVRNLPFIIVLAKTAYKSGAQWTVPFSHELLEAIADPTGVGTRIVGDTVYALEVCDPVALHSYPLSGERVTNFVTPAWFDAEGSAPYDFVGVLTAPAQISPGGYKTSIVAGRGWQTVQNRDGQYLTVPESLSAPGPRVRPRPRLDRAARTSALNNPQPTARVGALESRVALLENRLGFQSQTGTVTTCGMVCSTCSMVCSTCSMVCSTCSMVCSMCGMVCSMCSMVCSMCGMVCSMCNGCNCGCCGQGQAQGGGQDAAALANLGQS